VDGAKAENLDGYSVTGARKYTITNYNFIFGSDQQSN
jgi:hypothetical protein